MLLGFKERFVPYIEDGSKTHTIRALRGTSPRVGEICHCYTGLRRKGARLLGRWPCVAVDAITIEWVALSPEGTLLITVNGVELDRDEANALAWSDGFRSFSRARAVIEMHAYWYHLHGRAAFPFTGQLIHWARPV